MTVEMDNSRALDGTRVLDLCDEKGVYCAKLLAEMGADVVKVERPGGDETRAIGPFVHDVPDPERSLFFMHYNTSKRGITLDIEKPEGREILLRLIGKADVLVETFRPGYLAGLGLDYGALRELNPRLIMVSITDFGQTGPYRDYLSSDLIACALGGMISVCGDADTPPIRPYLNQAYHTASHFATIGTLMALYYRNFSGEGQYLDISLEDGIAAILEHLGIYYFYHGTVAKRQGTLHWSRAFKVFETKNGYALMSFRDRWDDMVAWLDSEGMAHDLADPRYRELSYRLDNLSHIIEVVAAFARTKTTEEIVEMGQLLRMPYGKVRDVAELVDDEHLIDRGFWVPVAHPELGATFKYPGAPFKAHGSPWHLRHRAPLIGEHNPEVYEGELGLTKEELSTLRERGVI